MKAGSSIRILPWSLLIVLAWPLSTMAQDWVTAEVYDRAGFAVRAKRMRIDFPASVVVGQVNGRPIEFTLTGVDQVHNLGPDRLLLIRGDGKEIVVDRAEIRIVDETGRGRGLTCYKTGSRGEVNFYFIDQRTGREELFTLCQADLAAVSFGTPLTWLWRHESTGRCQSRPPGPEQKGPGEWFRRRPVYWNRPAQ